MTTFSYKAVVADGRLVEGRVEASEHSAAVAKLAAERLMILELSPYRGAGFFRKLLTQNVTLGTSKRDAARKLIGRIALLVGAGVNVEPALQIIAGDGHDKTEVALAQALLWRLRDGDSLSKAMQSEPEGFSISTAAVVKAGERAGDLAATLAELSARLEKADSAKRNFQSALVYPGILVLTAIIAIGVVLLIVMPQLEPIFSDSRVAPPLVTRIAFGLSRLLRRDWPLLLTVLSLAAAACFVALRIERVRERLDQWLLRSPLLGRTLANAEAAAFSRAASAMLEGGVSLPAALKLCEAAAGNRSFRQAIREAHAMVREGRRLSAACGSNPMVPRLLVQLAALGEATGQLGRMLGKAADILDTEVERDLTRFASLLTPTLTFVVGGFVAAIVASVMIVVTSLGDALQ